MGKILVINYGAPELNSTAAYLSEKDLLAMYVSRYVNKNRAWEKLLACLPIIGNIISKSIGRRSLPSKLNPAQVHEAVIGIDFLQAITVRLSNTVPVFSKVASALHYYIVDKVEQEARSYIKHVDIVVSNVGCAKSAFEATLGRKVLNYPTANYQYTQKIMKDEYANVPEFSGTWSSDAYKNKGSIEKECELADVILVGSTFAKQSMEDVGISPDKVIIVPYGVDNTLFFPSKKNNKAQRDKFNVLFSGQITQRKGIYYLLEAYKRFSSTETQLTLIGNYQGSTNCFKPYSHLYTHIPNIPRPILAEKYRNADVYVFPTLIEGLGLTVLEAMSSGLPIITTSNGPGDAVRDGVDGFIVKPHDIDAIVEKLQYLKDNPDARFQMGENARQRALVFSWENYTVSALSAIQDNLQIHPGLSVEKRQHS